ncbi:MAG TPA: response regulator [Gammaproteobacteria bacterium]|nr:response regulator [Gammaproteobacteria bacterium]
MSESAGKTRYLTPNEAASRLMISPVTLRHWALAGKLAFVTTPGGHRRFAEDDIERLAAQHSLAGGGVLGDSQTQRILIVDDDTQLCGFLVELLQGLPDSVQTDVATNGFEAGQKLHTFRPHTVLLDLMMPGMNGFEVCRQIKQDPETQDVRVVVMTGYHIPENVNKAIEAGAEACLAKPLDKIQLFKAIVLSHSSDMSAQA